MSFPSLEVRTGKEDRGSEKASVLRALWGRLRCVLRHASTRGEVPRNTLMICERLTTNARRKKPCRLRKGDKDLYICILIPTVVYCWV